MLVKKMKIKEKDIYLLKKKYKNVKSFEALINN